MADVCDQCNYPVIQVDGRWVHAQMGDEAMCTILRMADRGRALQAAVDELGCGKPEPRDA